MPSFSRLASSASFLLLLVHALTSPAYVTALPDNYPQTPTCTPTTVTVTVTAGPARPTPNPAYTTANGCWINGAMVLITYGAKNGQPPFLTLCPSCTTNVADPSQVSNTVVLGSDPSSPNAQWQIDQRELKGQNTYLIAANGNYLTRTSVQFSANADPGLAGLTVVVADSPTPDPVNSVWGTGNWEVSSLDYKDGLKACSSAASAQVGVTTGGSGQNNWGVAAVLTNGSLTSPILYHNQCPLHS